MQSTLINILIRTSGRPNYFKKAVQSVEMQTYKNWRIIVSVDDKESEKYVQGYEFIRPRRRARETGYFFNRYFNDLLNKVKEGFVIYLDDDVEIIDPLFFEKIATYMEQDVLILWKYQFENGRIIPEKEYFGREPVRKHIDTGCFSHSIKYKHRWTSLRASDWRVAMQLYKEIPNKAWIDEVFIRAGNNGGLGKRKDI